jgi:hypothetical protein
MVLSILLQVALNSGRQQQDEAQQNWQLVQLQLTKKLIIINHICYNGIRDAKLPANIGLWLITWQAFG